VLLRRTTPALKEIRDNVTLAPEGGTMFTDPLLGLNRSQFVFGSNKLSQAVAAIALPSIPLK
jgi:hypothetical protein